MLTGQCVFSGETVSETLAAVMMKEPKWDRLPAGLPSLGHLIRRCLQKDPHQRTRDIGDVRLALEGAFETTVAAESLPIPSLPVWQRPMAIGVALLAASTISGLAVWALYENPAQELPVRFTLPVPDGYERTVSAEISSLAVSPDGTVIVYRENGMLVQRSLGEEDAQPIPGTEGAESPFYSPDGEWLAYLQDARFRRISPDGVSSAMGNAQVDWAHGADWGADDHVVYGRTRLGIWRMSVSGGQPEQITDPSERADELGHMWPQSLGSGSLLLFSAIGPSGKWPDSKVVLLDLISRERFVVVEGGAYGRYVPSGHVVYVTEDGNIQAIPYDLESREAGTSVPVESNVLLGQEGTGSAQRGPAGGCRYRVAPSSVPLFGVAR